MKIQVYAFKCWFSECEPGVKMVHYAPFSGALGREFVEVKNLAEIEEAEKAFSEKIKGLWAGSYFVKHRLVQGEKALRGYRKQRWAGIEVEVEG